MATGTGKTYTAFQIIWRLWKAGRKKHILFLADRDAEGYGPEQGQLERDGNEVEDRIRGTGSPRTCPCCRTGRRRCTTLVRRAGSRRRPCGAPNPRGIVTWTGVRFADFAEMLGLHEGVHYCRFTAADDFYVDEDMDTLRHDQVLLAWLMNGEPIPADHGAPLRLIVPFRYGNRSIKSITGMMFATPGLPRPPA